MKRVLTVLIAFVGLSLSAHAQTVMTPAGLLSAECVHQVPSGSHVLNTHNVRYPDGSLHPISACPSSNPKPAIPEPNPSRSSQPINTNGWVSGAYINGAPNTLVGQWTVPELPLQNDQQTIFIFNGIGGAGGSDGGVIIQPVLSWSGSKWYMQSWVCNNGSDCVASPPIINLNPGDQILGTVAYNPTQQTWTITSQDITLNTSTVLNSTAAFAGTPYDAVAAALEVYGIVSCNDYPSSATTFYNTFADGQTGQIAAGLWQNDGCNEQINVAPSSSQINIIPTLILSTAQAPPPPPPPPPPVNGVCGSANGQQSGTPPTSDLCSVGTSSAATRYNFGWVWSCAGSNDGTTAQCYAP